MMSIKPSGSTLSAFIGVRSGSTRAQQKNVRPFDLDGSSLLIRKLNQLYLVEEIDEIIVSSNCPMCIDQALTACERDKRIKVHKRDDSLCQTTTKVEDLAKHIASVSISEDIIWLHVTSPYIDSASITKGIKLYYHTPKSDSVFSANKLQNFIWDPVNRLIVNNLTSANKWPNTQDLSTLYELNHGFYIAKRSLLEHGERIGANPTVYECHGAECIDIDWEADFEYAQIVGAGIAAKAQL